MLEVDPKTGWVKEPQYLCLKGHGLCLIRRTDTPNFDCTNKTMASCPYRCNTRPLSNPPSIGDIVI